MPPYVIFNQTLITLSQYSIVSQKVLYVQHSIVSQYSTVSQEVPQRVPGNVIQARLSPGRQEGLSYGRDFTNSKGLSGSGRLKSGGEEFHAQGNDSPRL